MNTQTFRLSLPWLGAVLALSIACGSEQQVEPGAATPELEPVEEAAAELMVHEARVNLMPDMGALYLTVHNPGPQGDRLLSVEVGIASVAETHETVEDEGVMRMVARPQGFEVPPTGQLVLEPGGKHVMLFSPQEPEGDTVAVVLHFEKAGAVEVDAAVSKGGDSEDHSGGHSMDHSVDSHGGGSQ